MKIDAFMALHAEMCEQAAELVRCKNADYGSTEEAMFNLKACERMGLGDAEVGILHRMLDKFSRLITANKIGADAMQVLEDGTLGDELDLINYVIFLSARRRERAGGPEYIYGRGWRARPVVDDEAFTMGGDGGWSEDES